MEGRFSEVATRNRRRRGGTGSSRTPGSRHAPTLPAPRCSWPMIQVPASRPQVILDGASSTPTVACRRTSSHRGRVRARQTMRGLRWIVLTTARDLLQEGRSGGSDFCHGSVADPAIVAARGRGVVSPAGAGSWLLIVSLSCALATYDLQGDDARHPRGCRGCAAREGRTHPQRAAWAAPCRLHAG